MIKEDYVSFETAKLLKEKGFQAKCTACYHSDPSHTFKLISGRINYCNPRFSKCKMIPPYNAPTLQMAMKWLREIYGLYIVIRPYVTEEGTFSLFDIKSIKEKGIVVNLKTKTGFTTYEEACEAAIKYCLENLRLALPDAEKYKFNKYTENKLW